MGDVTKAMRDLQWVRSAIESRQWDSIPSHAKRVEDSLVGLADEEKEPVATELAKLVSQAVAEERAQRGQRIIEGVDRAVRLAKEEPDRSASTVENAMEMLDGELAVANLDREERQRQKQRLLDVTQANGERRRAERLEKADRALAELDARLAKNPYLGLSEHDVRSASGEVTQWITRARDALSGVSDVAERTARVDRLEATAAAHLAEFQEQGASSELERFWQQTEEGFRGWESETPRISWDAYFAAYGGGFADLTIPLTLRAVQDVPSFLERTKMLQNDSPACRRVLDRAHSVHGTALAKLHEAFKTLADQADAAPNPSSEIALTQYRSIGYYVTTWFSNTPLFQANQQRVSSIIQKWEDAIFKREADGKALYAKLEAEALAKWPSILSSLPHEEGFEPHDWPQWKGKTVLLRGLWNRAGWDYMGFEWAETLRGKPLGGYYERNVTQAMDEAVRVTRQIIDDHKEWELLAVVEGTATIQKREHEEVMLPGSSQKVKTERWNPMECVRLRIVALRAGPVAVGPAS